MTFKQLSEFYFRMADRAEANGDQALADQAWDMGARFAAKVVA